MSFPLHLLWCRRRMGTLACAALFILTGGCQNNGGRGRETLRGDPPPPPTIPSVGSGTFFDGRLLATLEVGSTDFTPADAGAGGPGGASEGKGKALTGDVQASASNRGANVGGNLNYNLGGTNLGLGLGGAGASLGLGLGGGSGKPPKSGDAGEGPAPAGISSMGSPTTLHLRFANQGKEPIEFSVVDFVSPLGNFVVQPERLTLAPGQWVETEPMSSQLVGSVTEASVKLVLHTAGKTEANTIVLHARVETNPNRVEPQKAPP